MLELVAAKPRRLLAVLALHHGRPVGLDTIAEAVWGSEPPPSAAVTLQGYVSKLRKLLEPDRSAREAGTVIRTSALGYTLLLEPDALDVVRLEEAVRAASAVVRSDPGRPWLPVVAEADEEQVHALAAALDAELAGWRGEPYADLADDPGILAERARLAEVRTAAVELRESIRLRDGGAAEAARHLEAELPTHPHRERLWLLYAAALASCSRQIDGLAALRTLRQALREDLAVDPGRPVADLETAILQQQVGAGPTVPDAEEAPLRVAVVDDHPVFRMGMSGLIGALDGMTVTGAAGDAAAARTLVARGADVVLMDLDLGGESGIALSAELLAADPDLRILVMTMHEDAEHVTAALEAGASGYLLKSAEADDVKRAIRGVARGELIIGPAVARAARSRLTERTDRP